MSALLEGLFLQRDHKKQKEVIFLVSSGVFLLFIFHLVLYIVEVSKFRNNKVFVMGKYLSINFYAYQFFSCFSQTSKYKEGWIF